MWTQKEEIMHKNNNKTGKTDMTDKEKIQLLLEVLDDLLQDYRELIGDAYDEENFSQFDRAVNALEAIQKNAKWATQ